MIKLLNLLFESKYQYRVTTDREEYLDALLDLATLDMEDDQVHYPDVTKQKLAELYSGRYCSLYIANREELPSSGSFEIYIMDNDDEVIGFIRGTKSDKIVSFNLIYIEYESRGKGIGTEVYEMFLDDGYIMRSDDEITSDTYNMYYRLAREYEMLLFSDGRVGLKK